MNIFSWIGLALTAAILSATIKQYQPVFALLTAIGAGICLLWAGTQALAQLAAVLRGFADTAGMQSEIFLPVLKAVGIAAAVRIAGAICKDAGQGALAVKLELLGSIAALTACLPLFTQLLSLVGNMLE